MDMHENKQQLQEALVKIINDYNFKKSARSVHLLKFLFDKLMQGEDVNEIMVGEELFNNNYNYENNDSKARVYMHFLRKKLGEYYFNNQTNTSIKFEIKKGQYNLSFSEYKGKQKSLSPVSSFQIAEKLKYIAFSLTIGLAIGLLVEFENPFKGNNYCWNEFFDSKSENLCIVSDHFVISHQHSSGKLASVHPKINTQEEFITYLQQNSNTGFELADYSFLTKMAPITIKTLNSWFIKQGNDFTIRFEEDIEMDEVRNKNFIFIGSYRVMGNFKNLFLSNSTRFNLEEGRAEFSSYNDGIKETFRTQYPNFRNDNNKNKQLFTEYAMVSFMTLDHGNKGLFFSSNHDIGVMATSSRFTNKRWLKNFYKSNNIDKDAQFNALFEVSGLERSELNCKLVEVEVIEE